MHLDLIKFRSFRNLTKVDLILAPGFNIFWGLNGQGKTNVLEGIYLLGHLKSFRPARNEELIHQGNKRGLVGACVKSRQVSRQIDLTIEPNRKIPRLDGKSPKKAGDFFGFLRPILFAPEEVSIARGGPGGRRGLIDRAIFQTDPHFLDRSREYDRHLRQRNRLLKDERPAAELGPWTEGLVKTGARLRKDRFEYIQELTPNFRNIYREISGGREEADILYPIGEGSQNALEERLSTQLARIRSREIRLGQTLEGPHRDDPDFLIDGRPLKVYGSQGQQRSFILAFKTAQIIDLERRLGEPPVLLLDDMTSELDRRRQGFLFRFLQGVRGQVFITTTDIQPLLQEGLSPEVSYRVSEGQLFRENF